MEGPQRDDGAGAEPQDADLGAGRLPARLAPHAGGEARRPTMLDGAGIKIDGKYWYVNWKKS